MDIEELSARRAVTAAVIRAFGHGLAAAVWLATHNSGIQPPLLVARTGEPGARRVIATLDAMNN